MSTTPPPPDRPVVVHHQGTEGVAHPGERGWEVELHAGTGRLDVATASSLLDDLVQAVADHGGGPVHWRVPDATAEHHRIATAAGLVPTRRLLQMRRSLPVPHTTDLDTRPFEPGRDDEDWLRVNNAAFAWHPEQSEWTHQHLRDHEEEPWFDPNGFLVHPTTGPLLGFCWTKVHDDLDPPLGEIYVIGVHPDAAGRGMGRALVLAGLEHLAGLGLDTAMLYTEADNRPAVALYEKLGFTIHHTVTVFERDVAAQIPTPMAEPIP